MPSDDLTILDYFVDRLVAAEILSSDRKGLLAREEQAHRDTKAELKKIAQLNAEWEKLDAERVAVIVRLAELVRRLEAPMTPAAVLAQRGNGLDFVNSPGTAAMGEYTAEMPKWQDVELPEFYSIPF